MKDQRRFSDTTMAMEDYRRFSKNSLRRQDECETEAGTENAFDVRDSVTSSPVIEFYPDFVLDISRRIPVDVSGTDRMYVQTLVEEHPTLESSSSILYKLISFLRSCDYTNVDIVTMLVYASCYVDEILVPFRADEMAHCFILFVFLSHSYTQDETCPLRYWHKSMFSELCSLRSMNEGLIRLQRDRNFNLRLYDQQLLQQKYALFSR